MAWEARGAAPTMYEFLTRARNAHGARPAISYQIKGGKLSGVKLAYNGLAPAPCRAPKIEAVLEGKAPEQVSAADIDAAVAASFTARDGVRATWASRSVGARNLVLEFIEERTQEVA